MSRRVEEDALELVVWYESRPGHQTTYKDKRIAAELGWLKGGDRAGRYTKGEAVERGDAGRVRAARRWVDNSAKHYAGDHQVDLFDGYTFGTKQNGAGVRTSTLIKRGAQNADELSLGVGEQIGRALQADQQYGSEMERMIFAFTEAKQRYMALAEYEKAFAVDHCIRDLEQKGRIEYATAQEATKAGITLPRGAAL